MKTVKIEIVAQVRGEHRLFELLDPAVAAIEGALTDDVALIMTSAQYEEKEV